MLCLVLFGIWSPKYVNLSEFHWTVIPFINRELRGRAILFVRLILYPEIDPYWFSVSINAGMATSGSTRNVMTSSVYKDNVWVCSPVYHLICVPWKDGWDLIATEEAWWLGWTKGEIKNNSVLYSVTRGSLVRYHSQFALEEQGVYRLYILLIT